MKSRKEKSYEYYEKYALIPDDLEERLSWMYDKFNINDRKAQMILNAKQTIMNELRYTDFKIVLHEEPAGTPRPRFRLVNRYNLANEAMNNGQFVKVYSITGAEDRRFMRQLITSGELNEFQELLYTPCRVEYSAYVKTPSNFNTTQIFLAEIGLERPINKPDWDNIGKKYSDMMNGNIWLDDTLVIDGSIHKFYSIKPRVEINLSFANILYNKYQYKSTIKKLQDLGVNTDNVKYFDF